MKKQPFLISWQGVLSIEEILPKRDELLTALNQYAGVTIDVSELKAIDLSFLQLLCSACGSASIRGKQLRLHGAENQILNQELEKNGLNFRDNCLRSRTNNCLWPKEMRNN